MPDQGDTDASTSRVILGWAVGVATFLAASAALLRGGAWLGLPVYARDGDVGLALIGIEFFSLSLLILGGGLGAWCGLVVTYGSLRRTFAPARRAWWATWARALVSFVVLTATVGWLLPTYKTWALNTFAVVEFLLALFIAGPALRAADRLKLAEFEKRSKRR